MDWNNNRIFTLDDANFTLMAIGDEPMGIGQRHSQTVAISSSALQTERIAKNPDILGGAPYVKGTRIPVATIMDGLTTEGLTFDELRLHYPRLTNEDIKAALEYQASLALAPAD